MARDTAWWSDWIRQDVHDVHNWPKNPHEYVGVLLHVACNRRRCEIWHGTRSRRHSERDGTPYRFLPLLRHQATGSKLTPNSAAQPDAARCVPRPLRIEGFG